MGKKLLTKSIVVDINNLRKYIMPLYKHLYIFIVLSVLMGFTIAEYPIMDNHLLTNNEVEDATNVCPSDDETNHAIMEEFLTIPEWSPARGETNTDHLTTSQINYLKDYENKSICKQLNDTYKEFISESWSDNGKTFNQYDITYYRVGDFYFVVISLSQYAGYISAGVAYIDVYDNNLNRLKGYAF